MATRKRSAASLKRRRTQLVSRIPDLTRVLRGSLVERYKRCGKPGCHCVHDKGHGPATYLSLTLAPGKTRSYYVPARLRDQVSHYIGNHQKLRLLLEEIIGINRELLERGELDDDDG